MRVFDELKQRKVLQTAALYFAIAWRVTEVLSFLVERIPVFPAWTETAIAILFILGFPVAVFLAWMFDIAPTGIRRDKSAAVSDKTDGPPSVAVLPFADMSPEQDQGYFCEGIAEAILNALAQIEALRDA